MQKEALRFVLVFAGIGFMSACSSTRYIYPNDQLSLKGDLTLYSKQETYRTDRVVSLDSLQLTTGKTDRRDMESDSVFRQNNQRQTERYPYNYKQNDIEILRGDTLTLSRKDVDSVVHISHLGGAGQGLGIGTLLSFGGVVASVSLLNTCLVFGSDDPTPAICNGGPLSIVSAVLITASLTAIVWAPIVGAITGAKHTYHFSDSSSYQPTPKKRSPTDARGVTGRDQ